ncbi:MAG TPA: DUF433 domain-containing protein [Chloroflexota bacterium]|jgi:uncharacterized protein (DUF433 family)|nr:DUF433 domain-containing protein [Chloroflexota bacterium]
MMLEIAPVPVPLRVDEHGVVRVGNTRVTLDSVIGRFLDGATPEQIVQSYTTLKLADVYAVIAYYLRNREEVDAYLQEEQRQAEAARAEYEKRFPPDPDLRRKLLERLAERADAAARGR